jgi:4-hydroxythreonine-4-phosphate dehydrogenase
MNNRPIIGLTMGDPAGVGPELCLRTLVDPDVLRTCVPVVFGHIEVLRRVSKAVGLPLPEVMESFEELPPTSPHEPQGRAHSPLRAVGNDQDAWVGNRGAQRTDAPCLCEFKGARRARSSGNSLHEPGRADLSVSLDARQRVPAGFAGFSGNLSGPVVVNCPTPEVNSIEPGKVNAACGGAAFGYIKTAITAALAGRIVAVATAPIHKEALRLAEVPFPGHTEIFTALTGARRSCMMLWSSALTVSMVTTHIGYGEVPQRLGVERILDVVELTAEALGAMNGRPAKLAICGLNPHAGEHGLFGEREEERFIEPAVAEARARGISVEGPLPPDTAFTTDVRKRFDGIVTLYHDQGHIPFKMLAFDDGVNITLGLPIVRTSVDHGTAFDIAWKGVARPTSLFKAVECAVHLGQARRA